MMRESRESSGDLGEEKEKCRIIRRLIAVLISYYSALPNQTETSTLSEGC